MKEVGNNGSRAEILHTGLHIFILFASPFYLQARFFFLRTQLSPVVNRRIVPIVVVDDPKQPSIVICMAPICITPTISRAAYCNHCPYLDKFKSMRVFFLVEYGKLFFQLTEKPIARKLSISKSTYFWNPNRLGYW
uniref:Uncharacterized protein n=1 Tax=Romanomermis culicivorax TaxID=13658 RepID=A0A915J8K6_ROMCU